jgi:hypothetical protein
MCWRFDSVPVHPKGLSQQNFWDSPFALVSAPFLATCAIPGIHLPSPASPTSVAGMSRLIQIPPSEPQFLPQAGEYFWSTWGNRLTRRHTTSSACPDLPVQNTNSLCGASGLPLVCEAAASRILTFL